MGKEDLCFPVFSWILQWLGTVFTLLSGQEARFTFLGFIAVVLAPVWPYMPSEIKNTIWVFVEVDFGSTVPLNDC